MPDDAWVYPLLLAAGLVAGGVDSVAGGGGLVTIPVLLWLGIPPQMVLGTNKFQASFGSFTAASHYVREGVADLRAAWWGIGWTAGGSALGTVLAQSLDPALLDVAIPFLLLAVAVYMAVVPRPLDADRPPRCPAGRFYGVAGLLLGFYDGFFGPGVGSFWAIALMGCLGLGLTRATGYTKVMNFTSNVVSFLIFLLGGHVLFAAGAVMALGQIVGARIGSGLVIRRGARFIRPVFIAVVILTSLKLIYSRLA